MDYLLKNIDPDLWRASRSYAATHGVTIRSLILGDLACRIGRHHPGVTPVPGGPTPIPAGSPPPLNGRQLLPARSVLPPCPVADTPVCPGRGACEWRRNYHCN